MINVAVLGAGTWGVVIADLLTTNGHNVSVWARNENQVENLNKYHMHDKLDGIHLDEKISFTADMGKAIEGTNVVIYAVPSTGFREVVEKSIPYINNNQYLVSLTKGMEENTLLTMSEIIVDELKKHNVTNDKVVVLSGPTIAEEVLKKFPTTIVSASKSEEASKYIQDLCMNKYFRVYTNSDVKGVEICAAFKNVIALSSGILNGLGFGDNIKAALITRGLTEMIRVGNALNCNKDTFYGLAGIGDMIVTATSPASRNFRFGKLLGKGMKTEDALREISMVVEGVNFLPKAKSISEKYNIDLPISNGAYEIVINKKDPKEILTLLMTRSKKAE